MCRAYSDGRKTGKPLPGWCGHSIKGERERDAMNETEGLVAREQRTPSDEALAALSLASIRWAAIARKIGLKKADGKINHEEANAIPDDPEGLERFVFLKLFQTTWSDPKANGEAAENNLRHYLADNYKASVSSVRVIMLFALPVIAYAVQALKAEEAGRRDEAWTYAIDAWRWADFLWFSGECNPAAILAKKRHTENRAMAEEAMKFWRENMDTSLSASKAANELVQVVSLSHKKLAELVAAEKKKLKNQT